LAGKLISERAYKAGEKEVFLKIRQGIVRLEKPELFQFLRKTSKLDYISIYLWLPLSSPDLNIKKIYHNKHKNQAGVAEPTSIITNNI
jgi:hypothetical protein